MNSCFRLMDKYYYIMLHLINSDIKEEKNTYFQLKPFSNELFSIYNETENQNISAIHNININNHTMYSEIEVNMIKNFFNKVDEKYDERIKEKQRKHNNLNIIDVNDIFDDGGVCEIFFMNDIEKLIFPKNISFKKYVIVSNKKIPYGFMEQYKLIRSDNFINFEVYDIEKLEDKLRTLNSFFYDFEKTINLTNNTQEYCKVMDNNYSEYRIPVSEVNEDYSYTPHILDRSEFSKPLPNIYDSMNGGQGLNQPTYKPVEEDDTYMPINNDSYMMYPKDNNRRFTNDKAKELKQIKNDFEKIIQERKRESEFENENAISSSKPYFMSKLAASRMIELNSDIISDKHNNIIPNSCNSFIPTYNYVVFNPIYGNCMLVDSFYNMNTLLTYKLPSYFYQFEIIGISMDDGAKKQYVLNSCINRLFETRQDLEREIKCIINGDDSYDDKNKVLNTPELFNLTKSDMVRFNVIDIKTFTKDKINSYITEKEREQKDKQIKYKNAGIQYTEHNTTILEEHNIDYIVELTINYLKNKGCREYVSGEEKYLTGLTFNFNVALKPVNKWDY